MKIINILAIVCVITYLSTTQAFAYLDPGTGSMIVQILVAAFATVAIFFRSIFSSIKTFFMGKKAKTAQDDESDDE